MQDDAEKVLHSIGELQKEDTPPSDSEIIRQVQAGDKNAFAELVLRYQDRVYGTLYRRTCNEPLAEELTQETFIRAYRCLSSFRGEAQFSTWLIQIGLNLTRTYYRSKRFRQISLTINLADAPQHEAALQYDSYDRAAIRRIKEIAAQLSPKLADVFILSALQQKSYQEVAKILGLPVGTVRSRLHKARLKVKKLYFEEEEEQ